MRGDQEKAIIKTKKFETEEEAGMVLSQWVSPWDRINSCRKSKDAPHYLLPTTVRAAAPTPGQNTTSGCCF